MIYVAGVQPETVCGHVLADDDGAFRFGRSKLLFPVTPQGDGTVTWASGELPGVPMYYAEDTAHDALCAKDFGRRTFAGYTELLLKGTTTRLPSTRPATRSASRASARPALRCRRGTPQRRSTTACPRKKRSDG
jgi:hypothetical protein